MRPTRLPTGLILLLVSLASLLILHGCQETPDATQPSTSVAGISHRLTVLGVGTGTGVVTSSPAGINCTITAGVAAATGCTALFDQTLRVSLTATPVAGHSFGGWARACTGSTVCTLSMTVDRLVSAQFLRGPFRITVTGGSTGAGSGTVTTQSGLIPAINCKVTSGAPAATGCSAVYRAYTSVILTATPAAGNAFVGWGSPCSGTGPCKITVTKNRSPSATFAPQPSADQGQWSAPFPWPVVGIHLHLLPTGEVLTFGKLGTPRVWAVSTGTFTPVSSSYLMFCGGHAFLPDGRLLLTGGHISHDHGLPDANIFDPATRTLTRVPSMAQGRWYPTSTALASGEVVTVGGADESGVMVAEPEVWDGTSWRKLTGASLPLPYYPWLFQAPNGEVFYAGPSTSTRYLNPTGTGSWGSVLATSAYGERPTGTAVMYEPGKVLIAGGGGGTETTLPTATAEIIDLTGPSPVWQSTASMAFPRRHLTATLLPDGKVLAIGGTRGPGYNDAAGTVHEAEIWDPATGTWKTLAPNTINRIYHSASLLLPDGRILVTGSGARTGDVDQLNAELYSPPYLLRGPRPILTDAPPVLSYGTSFVATTPEGSSIAKVTLVRLGSVTHSFDQNQRFMTLTFEAGTTGITVTAPASPNLAPPGDYLLFILNGDGVPSVGRFVRIH
jgi:hypothetical protein